MTLAQSLHHANGAPPLPRLISIKQTTVILGIGRTLTYELIALGKLKTVRIGRRRFVPVDVIEQFLAGLSEKGPQ